MRVFTAFIALIFCVPAHAQVQEVVSAHSRRPTDAVPQLSSHGDTLDLPFNDDFSYMSSFPNPGLWTDMQVLVNNQFALKPWGWGVATFDGLDESGRAYNLNKNSSDTLADVLTSHHLDLSGVNAPFLSFVYQGGGFGDPTESGDSLVVDFWSVDSARWERVWSANGGVNDQWDWAIISADEPKWKKRGFRFRIGNYGALSGSFDIWNINYVSLRANRTAADTIIEDPAHTEPHPYLFNNFTKIPWFHESAINYRNNLTFYYRRNGPVPTGGWQLNLGKYRIYQDATEIARRDNVPVISNLDHNMELNFQVPVPSVPVTAPTDEFTLKMVTFYDGEAVGVRRNDTLIGEQKFDNSYAYDDGTAEAVYGLNQAGSTMLFLFQPLVSDTMKGLQIQFGQAHVDASQTEFRIVIYSFNNGVPGSIIYESDSLYKPKYMPGRNMFATYELDIPGQFIGGAVYIGLKQLSATPLNVGLDRNTTGLTNIVYGDGANWYPSIHSGTLMIRPYFRYPPKDLGSPDNRPLEQDAIRVWPNPTDGRVTLELHRPQAKATLYNLNGQAVWTGRVRNGEVLDLGPLPDGMYILRLNDRSWSATKKIVIRNK